MKFNISWTFHVFQTVITLMAKLRVSVCWNTMGIMILLGNFKLDRSWHCWSKSIRLLFLSHGNADTPVHQFHFFFFLSIFSSSLKVGTAALMWNSSVGFHSAELHHSLYHGRAESSAPTYITNDIQTLQSKAFIWWQETTHPMFLELDGYVLNIC